MSQISLFNIEPIAEVKKATVKNISTNKVRIAVPSDTSSIGLNATFEGRNDKFKDFADYIRNKSNKI